MKSQAGMSGEISGSGWSTPPRFKRARRPAMIHVGNLDPQTTSADLEPVFVSYPSFQRLQFFDANKSRGRNCYAVALFTNDDGARDCLDEKNFVVVKGSAIRMRAFTPGFAPGGAGGAWVAVKGLPPGTTARKVFEKFRDFGTVWSIMPIEYPPNAPRAVDAEQVDMRVHFESESAAASAIAAAGRKPLKVEGVEVRVSSYVHPTAHGGIPSAHGRDGAASTGPRAAGRAAGAYSKSGVAEQTEGWVLVRGVAAMEPTSSVEIVFRRYGDIVLCKGSATVRPALSGGGDGGGGGGGDGGTSSGEVLNVYDARVLFRSADSAARAVARAVSDGIAFRELPIEGVVHFDPKDPAAAAAAGVRGALAPAGAAQPTRRGGAERAGEDGSFASLHVTGFPQEFSDSDLVGVFSDYASFKSVSIRPTRVPTYRVAKVTFGDPADAAEALRAVDGKRLRGVVLHVKPFSTAAAAGGPGAGEGTRSGADTASTLNIPPSDAFGATTGRAVMVRGVRNGVSTAQVEEYFLVFGPIVRCKGSARVRLVQPRECSVKEPYFGFDAAVIFEREKDAQRAVAAAEKAPVTFKGLPVVVEIADEADFTVGAAARAAGESARRGGNGTDTTADDTAGGVTSLYFSKLPPSITSADLQRMVLDLEPEGAVRVVLNLTSKSANGGSAKVDFTDARSARMVVRCLNGVVVDEKCISVAPFRSRTPPPEKSSCSRPSAGADGAVPGRGGGWVKVLGVAKGISSARVESAFSQFGTILCCKGSAVSRTVPASEARPEHPDGMPAASYTGYDSYVKFDSDEAADKAVKACLKSPIAFSGWCVKVVRHPEGGSGAEVDTAVRADGDAASEDRGRCVQAPTADDDAMGWVMVRCIPSGTPLTEVVRVFEAYGQILQSKGCGAPYIQPVPWTAATDLLGLRNPPESRYSYDAWLQFADETSAARVLSQPMAVRGQRVIIERRAGFPTADAVGGVPVSDGSPRGKILNTVSAAAVAQGGHRTVLVRGVTVGTTIAALSSAFEKYGEVERCKGVGGMRSERLAGVSGGAATAAAAVRGCFDAAVTFKSAASAARAVAACKAKAPLFKEHPVTSVELVVESREPSSERLTHDDDRYVVSRRVAISPEKSKWVVVQGIGTHVSPHVVSFYFTQYGKVAQVRIGKSGKEASAKPSSALPGTEFASVSDALDPDIGGRSGDAVHSASEYDLDVQFETREAANKAVAASSKSKPLLGDRRVKDVILLVDLEERMRTRVLGKVKPVVFDGGEVVGKAHAATISSGGSETALCVTRLAFGVSEADLRGLFGHFPSLVSVVFDGVGSRRRARVTFSSSSEAEMCRLQFNKVVVKGAAITVQPWNSQRSSSRKASGGGWVMVVGVAAMVPVRAVYEIFSQFGPILECKGSAKPRREVGPAGTPKAARGMVNDVVVLYEKKIDADNVVARSQMVPISVYGAVVEVRSWTPPQPLPDTRETAQSVQSLLADAGNKSVSIGGAPRSDREDSEPAALEEEDTAGGVECARSPDPWTGVDLEGDVADWSMPKELSSEPFPSFSIPGSDAASDKQPALNLFDAAAESGGADGIGSGGGTDACARVKDDATDAAEPARQGGGKAWAEIARTATLSSSHSRDPTTAAAAPHQGLSGADGFGAGVGDDEDDFGSEWGGMDEEVEVYVKGLSPYVSNTEFADYFSLFGQIVSVDMPRNDFEESVGHAYVEYETQLSAINAVRLSHEADIPGISVVGEQLEVVRRRNPMGIPNTWTPQSSKSQKMENQAPWRAAGGMNRPLNSSLKPTASKLSVPTAALPPKMGGRGMVLWGAGRNPVDNGKDLKCRVIVARQLKHCNFFVDNIDANVTDARLQEVFEQYGKLYSLMRVPSRVKSNLAHAFVCFMDEAGAAAAVEALGGKRGPLSTKQPLYMSVCGAERRGHRGGR